MTYSIAKKRLGLLRQKNVRTCFSPTKKQSLQKVKKCVNILKRKNARACLSIAKFQYKLNQIKLRMSNMNDKNLNEILDQFSIPQGQCELIKEIFSAAKVKNSKNKKYSENWMMLCLLFQIR